MNKELFSEHGLSLDRLKSFLDVVEAGSIVKAAGSDTGTLPFYGPLRMRRSEPIDRRF